MLNEQAGVIDDLIVYLSNEAETEYRIVSNAATRDKDLAQFAKLPRLLMFKSKSVLNWRCWQYNASKAIEKLLQAKPQWQSK